MNIHNTFSENANSQLIAEIDNDEKTFEANNFTHVIIANDADVTTTITDNNWTRVTNLFTVNDSSNGITETVSQITINYSGMYLLTMTVPLGTETSISKVSVGVGRGDAEPLYPLMIGNPAGTVLPENSSGSIIEPYPAGQVLKIYVKNSTNTQNITMLQTGHLTIHRLGSIPPNLL